MGTAAAPTATNVGAATPPDVGAVVTIVVPVVTTGENSFDDVLIKPVVIAQDTEIVVAATVAVVETTGAVTFALIGDLSRRSSDTAPPAYCLILVPFDGYHHVASDCSGSWYRTLTNYTDSNTDTGSKL